MISRVLFAVCLSWGLFGCSTAPETISHEVTRFEEISDLMMAEADRMRQLEHYDRALRYYSQAESYARKRHDMHSVGIALLKRAAIRLEQDKMDLAAQLIAQTDRIAQTEQPLLIQPVQFLEAKLAKQQGNLDKALGLIEGLESHYQAQMEKNAYYRIVRWSWSPHRVDAGVIALDVSNLELLKQNGQLQNVEIYSYAIFHYTRWLAAQTDSRFEDWLGKALAHFAHIELTPRIRDSYQLAKDYYQHTGEKAKADYYADAINALDNIH